MYICSFVLKREREAGVRGVQRMYWHLPRTFPLIKPNQKNDFLLCARSLDLPCVWAGAGPTFRKPHRFHPFSPG